MSPGLELADLGWRAQDAAAFDPHARGGRTAGRVLAEDRGSYVAWTAVGERRAAVTGRFRYDAGEDPGAYPAVGDWIALDATPEPAAIHAVLPRRSALIRQAAGLRTAAQVVGANLDVVFVTSSLNADLNVRRLERYLATAWESGAEPVVLLSKADLVPTEEAAAALAAVERLAVGTEVILASAYDGRGLDRVRERIAPGATVAFVGSSGVGKSTLVNRLAGTDLALVREIREDDARGRHTTTRRELHLLPDGGLVLDTPGMRELALWDGDGLDRSFADVEELAASCRFGNCRHAGEPGCAIAAALVDGRLTADRHGAWQKLVREARHQERRTDARARNEERRRWKQIGKAVARHMDAKYGEDGWR